MGEHGEATDDRGEQAVLLVTLPDGSRYALPAAALAAHRIDGAVEQRYRELLEERAAPGFEYVDEGDAVTIRSVGGGAAPVPLTGMVHRRPPDDR
jgi:hypothetical protein